MKVELRKPAAEFLAGGLDPADIPRVPDAGRV
jgi:hypothetical protein